MAEDRILLCRCERSAVVPPDAQAAVLAGLAVAGVPVVTVADLCGRCAGRDPALLVLAEEASALTVVACHSRAVRWLLHAAGVRLPPERLHVLDMRTQTSAAILGQLSAVPTATHTPVAEAAPAAPAADDWPPWFPVIDYARCTQCKQCLSFCLFGVYALSPVGQVYVANPQNCKNNCPACARICPAVAIMFPKLPANEAPLNGDEIGDETELQARAKVNVQELLGSDVYAALAERRRLAHARRLKRPAAVAQAERERARHLA